MKHNTVVVTRMPLHLSRRYTHNGSIQYYDVIIRPVITEKSMADMGEKKYTFLVHPEANKTQIKEAVEKSVRGNKS